MLGMSAADADMATLRGNVVDIILGTVFLAIGVTACAIAAIRRRGGVRILVWLGIWSALYGLQTLDRPLAALAVLPHGLKSAEPYLHTAVMYLLLVSALFAWRELSVGKLRTLIQIEILVGLVIAVGGIGTFVLGGPRDSWMFYNNLLAVVALFILVLVTFVPRFSRSLVISNHRILAAGTLIFSLEAVYTNLMGGVFHLPILPLVDSLGFAALLFALGYVALEMVFTNERRLLSVETELETARQIQSSILPAGVPQIENLRIAASYLPMSAIAGDFYHFVQTDENHLGLFVADVSGHGIPAALISSMIKVAIQSVAVHADNPAKVLGGLNRILAAEFQGQLTSAAYLWIDAANYRARYSAAGHPPLFLWRNARELQRIESNGLLFGVAHDCDYPVCELEVEPHDRILLYTDGLVEPENARGEPFGDRRLEQVVRQNRSQPASELITHLLTELRNWQPPSTSQQDDITLIVVDVL